MLYLIMEIVERRPYLVELAGANIELAYARIKELNDQGRECYVVFFDRGLVNPLMESLKRYSAC